MPEISYQLHQKHGIVQDSLTQIDNDQRYVYHALLDCVRKQQGSLIFFDATGRTKLIIAKVRSEAK